MKRYQRKKKVYKKKRNYKRKNRIFRTPRKFGFPQVMYTKITWTANVGISQTAASIRTYYLNSLYDPGASLWGTQPMLYDQLSAIYTRYKVYATKVNI